MTTRIRKVIAAAARLAAKARRARADRRRTYMLTYLKLRRIALKGSK